ncbi:AAA domain-containing protein [Rhodococcus hoagii]|nr:AAA domain-containing protein [Prescottella equi]
MAIRDIEREHIEAAIDEFDGSDRKTILDTYGFGISTGYLVRTNGKFYDPKALIGVAHSYATGRPLTPAEFVTDDARAKLKKFDFPVVKFNGLWWVNQGSNYHAERDGGYVWAGQRAKNGKKVPSWSNVMKLKEGQLVLHYANQRIVAIGTVHGQPHEASDPESAALFNQYTPPGYLCTIDYRELEQPIPSNAFPPELLTAAPFDRNGKVNQGYMYPITEEYVLPVLSYLDATVPSLFDGEATHPSRYDEKKRPAADLASYEQDPILETLLRFKNLVLEGVPGTGKSFAIERIATQWKARTGRSLHSFSGRPYRTMVMHPSTSYEDFVEGLRPVPTSTTLAPGYFDEPAAADASFAVADGFFLEVCQAAVRAPGEDVLVLLDELNRCNISSVFGDLLLTLESSRRARPGYGATNGSGAALDWSSTTTARLPYSGRTFFVPENVYVIATTNTTDRSVAPLDAALRRRFAFHRLEPGLAAVPAPLSISDIDRDLFLRGAEVLDNVNEFSLRPCIGPDALLGHSYFYSIADELANDPAEAHVIISASWQYMILPQLIDSVRSHNAEDILDRHTRPGWFESHAEVTNTALDRATDALAALDEYLTESLGLAIIVEGTGLARGARVAAVESLTEDSEDEISLDEVGDIDEPVGADL